MNLEDREVYVNGGFCSVEDARISVFDRGLLFADAVYEVYAVLEGKLIDVPAHFARLRRSMRELGFDHPASDEDILGILKELLERNRVEQGMVYLQVSRGSAERDFLPPANPEPALFAFTLSRPVEESQTARTGIRVITVPDQRWGRRDIKTVALLAPSLAKRQAVEAGADDAWMVEHGTVTEGTANNAYIVTADNKIVTRPLSSQILAGCTRAAVLRLAEERGFEVEERAFTVEEAHEAAEAFITSATNLVTGVISIDGRVLSNGAPGPVTGRLREIYLEEARATAV